MHVSMGCVCELLALEWMDDGRLLGVDAEKSWRGRALTCTVRVMVMHGAAGD